MPDIQDLMRLHLEGSRRRDELLEDCRHLRNAGRISEAHRALREAEEIETRLKELEWALKPREP